MKAAGGKIGPTIYLLGIAGALLFTVLLVREGVHDVVQTVAAAGWWLVFIPVFHLLPLFLDSFEWWVLFRKKIGRDCEPPSGRAFWENHSATLFRQLR